MCPKRGLCVRCVCCLFSRRTIRIRNYLLVWRSDIRLRSFLFVYGISGDAASFGTVLAWSLSASGSVRLPLALCTSPVSTRLNVCNMDVGIER